MKEGITNNLTSLETLPDELLEKTVSYLPLSSFFGRNKLSVVSRKMREIVDSYRNSKQGKLRFNPEVFLQYFEKDKELKQDEALILSIISDSKFKKLLSLDQMIKIISNHSNVSKKLIEFFSKNSDLTDENLLVTLGKANLDSAKQILNTKNIKLNGRQLNSLCVAHLSLAEDFFETVPWYYLPELGIKHLSIALLILNRPDKMEKWATHDIDNTDFYLKTLGVAHLSVAQRILNTPKMLSKMQNYRLTSLGVAHLSIAEQILNTPNILSNMCGYHLRSLGVAHPSIAEQILDTPTILCKLTIRSLVQLGLVHRNIRKKIVENENLMAQIKYDDKELLLFLSKHTDKEALNDPKILSLLTSENLKYFMTNADNLKTILKNKALLRKLNYQDIIKLDLSNPDNAKLVLNIITQDTNTEDFFFPLIRELSFFEKLTTHMSIAEKIINHFQTLQHLDHIPPKTFLALRKHTRIANKIILDPKLRSKFNIMNHKEFLNHVSLDTLEKITEDSYSRKEESEKIITIANAIINMVKEEKNKNHEEVANKPGQKIERMKI